MFVAFFDEFSSFYGLKWWPVETMANIDWYSSIGCLDFDMAIQFSLVTILTPRWSYIKIEVSTLSFKLSTLEGLLHMAEATLDFDLATKKKKLSYT